MSKLDDIYLNTVYVTPPSGTIFSIDLKNDAVYQALKEQFKDHLLDLLKQSKEKMGPLTWLEKQITEL